MNDSLRDKIASVYRSHRLTFEGRSSPKCDCGWKSPEEYTTWTDHPEHMADAVIRELGLQPQSEVYKYGPLMPDGFQQAKLRHRYVTEWEPDD